MTGLHIFKYFPIFIAHLFRRSVYEVWANESNVLSYSLPLLQVTMNCVLHISTELPQRIQNCTFDCEYVDLQGPLTHLKTD